DTTPTAGPVAYEVVGVIGAPNCDTTASESCSVVVPQQSAFRRSDVNNDSQFNIADVVYVLQYLFANGAAPTCFDAADMNDDGGIDISDPVYMATYLFSLGAEPLYPFHVTDVDPTDDNLSCIFSVWGTP
ncbi:MAG: dockerin type I repeat-containing protein, partial [Planctomycetota bacterium]